MKEAGKDACLNAKGDILKPSETQSSAKYHLRVRLLLPKIYSADVTNTSRFMLGKQITLLTKTSKLPIK
jgi:hypothetical protein